MGKKVKIFSISGDFLSGKSTLMNNMIEKMKDLGFIEDNIHKISSDKMFREYFDKVMKIFENINNDEILKQLSEDETIKDIFNNPEYRKKIESIYVKLNGINFNFSDYDITLANSMQELEEIRNIIDESIDKKISELGRIIIKDNNPNEVWVIDSRLAFHNIPESFSVRLTVRDDIAAERLIKDLSRGSEDSKYKDLEKAKNKIIERKNTEQSRYKEKYNVDLDDENNYNLIIDTSFSNVNDITNTILECEELNSKNKDYSKKWASPKLFLPMQNIRETYGQGFGSYLNLEQIAESIKENGYNPTESIDVFKYNDKYCIYEGHHRNFACAYLGKTLIPYSEVTTLDENEKKQRYESINITNIYDHEDLFRERDENGKIKQFYYTEVYPDVYSEIKKNNEGR